MQFPVLQPSKRTRAAGDAMLRHKAQAALVERPKIESLESIRGLAALVVVFFHLPKWSSFLDVGFINNGYLMVDLFFVLSGFVIYMSYADRIRSRKDLFRFQFLRFGRLYPVHIVFLTVFATIELARYVASLKTGSSLTSPAFAINNVPALFENALLISSVLPNRPHAFNFPAWSISVEFYTYLVFALSVLLFEKHKHFVFLVFAITSLAMLATGHTSGFDDMLRCIAGFSIGCLTAELTNRCERKVPGFCSAAALLALAAFVHFKTPTHFDLMIYVLASALIAALVLSESNALKRMLEARVLTALGLVSYSLYMSHAAIEYAANQVIKIVLKRPEALSADGKSVPQLTQIEAVLACLAVAVAALAVSALVYRFIEKPMRERSRSFAFERLR